MKWKERLVREGLGCKWEKMGLVEMNGLKRMNFGGTTCIYAERCSRSEDTRDVLIWHDQSASQLQPYLPLPPHSQIPMDPGDDHLLPILE